MSDSTSNLSLPPANSPYLPLEPGAVLRSSDWNNLQKLIRAHVQTHSHAGGDEGRRLSAEVLQASGHLSVARVSVLEGAEVGGPLRVTGALTVSGRDLLAELDQLRAQNTAPQAPGTPEPSHSSQGLDDGRLLSLELQLQQLTALLAQVGAVVSSSGSDSSDVSSSEFQQTVKRLEAAIEARVSNELLSSQLGPLQAQLEPLQAQLAPLQAQVGPLQAQVAGLSDQLSVLSTSVQSSLETHAHTGGSSGVKLKGEAIDGRTSLSVQYLTVGSSLKVGTTDVGASLSSLTTRVDALDQKVQSSSSTTSSSTTSSSTTSSSTTTLTVPPGDLVIDQGALVLRSGSGTTAGLRFPVSASDGGGDSAFLRYFVSSVEKGKLLLGIDNDAEDALGLWQQGAERLSIWSGRVGINKTAPSVSLDVAGSSKISYDLFVGHAAAIGSTDTEGERPLFLTSVWSGTSTSWPGSAEIANDTQDFKALMLVGNTSAGAERRVGVWDRLDVHGQLAVVSSSAATARMEVQGDAKVTRLLLGDRWILNGAVSSSTPDDWLRLEVGPLYYTSRLGAFCCDKLWVVSGAIQQSDAQLKEQITPVSNALSRLEQIRGVQFHWQNGSGDRSPQLGVLAQEVAQVFPELVSRGPSGVLGVQYTGLIAPMLEAIKALNGQVTQLTAQLEQCQKALAERTGKP